MESWTATESPDTLSTEQPRSKFYLVTTHSGKTYTVESKKVTPENIFDPGTFYSREIDLVAVFYDPVNETFPQ